MLIDKVAAVAAPQQTRLPDRKMEDDFQSALEKQSEGKERLCSDAFQPKPPSGSGENWIRDQNQSLGRHMVHGRSPV